MSQATASDGSVRSILARTGTLVVENPLAIVLGPVGALALFVPYVGPVITVLLSGVLVELFARDLGEQSRDRSAALRGVSLVVGSIVIGVIVAIGTALFVVPGVYVAATSALAGPAIVIDSKGPLDGRSESVARTRGNKLRMLAVFAMTMALVLPAGLVHAVVTVPLRANIALVGVFGGLMLTVTTAATVVMYLAFSPAIEGGLGALGDVSSGGPNGYPAKR